MAEPTKAAATKAADSTKAADTKSTDSKPAERRPAADKTGKLVASALLEFAKLGRLTDETYDALRDVVDPTRKTDSEATS